MVRMVSDRSVTVSLVRCSLGTDEEDAGAGAGAGAGLGRRTRRGEAAKESTNQEEWSTNKLGRLSLTVGPQGLLVTLSALSRRFYGVLHGLLRVP